MSHKIILDMLDLMLFQAVVFITQASAKKTLVVNNLNRNLLSEEPGCLAAVTLGKEGKKKIRDQLEESLGGLLKEGPRGKILGKGRVGAT